MGEELPTTQYHKGANNRSQNRHVYQSRVTKAESTIERLTNTPKLNTNPIGLYRPDLQSSSPPGKISLPDNIV